MKFILKHKLPVLILLLSGFIVSPLLMPGFFRVQDYLQVIRIYEMRQCIEDLQIPCRWVSDMGSGYGFPLFNYYGVFPYYIAAFASYLLGFIGAAKLIFFLPLVFGGLFMYILVKEIFSKEAAFVAAVLYLFAPYRALDIYVRGSISEIFAMTLMPLVFYFSLKLIKSLSLFNFLAATFILATFFLNHNLMTMLFVPLLIVWIIYWLIVQIRYKESRKTVIIVLLSMLLGFLLASFFILPAYFEQNLIQSQNLRESNLIPNFRAHFVTVDQLFFSRFWGYGISTWGGGDGLSFQVGWPQWQLALITMFLLTYQVFRNKSLKKSKNLSLYLIFFFVSVVSLLMTHNKSAFLWEMLDKLQFVQFPWRFLSVAVFSVSFLGGAAVLFIRKKFQIYFVILVTILTVFLNYKYFQPVNFKDNLSDKDLLTGSEWQFYQQGSLTDYLPITAQEPTKIAPPAPFVDGDAKIENFNKSSNKFKFNIETKNQVIVTLPIFDFPNWQILANGSPVKHSGKGEFGTMQIGLGRGSYLIEGYFYDTPLRMIANLLSVFAAGLIILIVLKRKLLFH